MWMEAQLAEDLREIGLGAGASVLVHASLRAVGEIEGGAETLVRAFRDVLGPEGTLMIPAFRAEQESGTLARVGVFSEIVRQQPDAMSSLHPEFSFAALGARAEFLTANAPFHYPLGTDSPLARLHQLDGYVLLLGEDHAANASIHLAEVWADVPYIHRSRTVQIGPDEWADMRGSPECRAGFGRIKPILRQARLLKKGYIGNAESQLMRQRYLVSMAVAMLQGEGSSLLCDSPGCRWCITARKFVSRPDF